MMMMMMIQTGSSLQEGGENEEDDLWTTWGKVAIVMMVVTMVMVMVMVMTLMMMMIITWPGDQRVGREQEEASSGERGNIFSQAGSVEDYQGGPLSPSSPPR